ncbi:MAG: M48 family metalloprotease [Cyanobacteria bacterium J06632_19]
MQRKISNLLLSFSVATLSFAVFPLFTPALANTCLIEADALYNKNERTAAEKRYRQCKKPFPEENNTKTFFPTPITDPSQLSPSGQALWENAQSNSKAAVVPLQQLNQQHPEFTPAYIKLAKALKDTDQKKEALEVLEQAAILFPKNADIANARVKALRKNGDRLDASIAARLFAIVNREHPKAKKFDKLADKYLRSFKKRIKNEYIAKGVGVTACKIFLGNICGGGSTTQKITATIEMARMIVEGESGMGKRFARAIVKDSKKKGKFIEDPVINGYINKVGKEIAALMGRDEFKYEFYVIEEPSINAFALPGGKVFIHTGALLAANSEAEIAGLIGHEVAHAVLSHGYRGFANKQFLDSLGNAAPGGNLAKLGFQLLELKTSRSQERSADILGTRALAGYGYASDGLYNFFVTLKNQNASRRKTPEYLSTHPATDTRLSYLRAIIQKNGYNRYAYEGVNEYNEKVKKRLQKLIK